MRICHVSDWHAKLRPLPEAELYVVTGDMLPNFPLLLILKDGARKLETLDPLDPQVLASVRSGELRGSILGRKIDPWRERVMQSQWCHENPFRAAAKISPDAQVVVCRGNHDFIDLSDWIGGNVWEVSEDPTRTFAFADKVIGGARGIPYIAGEWSDELSRADLGARFRLLPDSVDVLLTHTPPRGVLDEGRHHFGVDELTSWINKRSYSRSLLAHCFGHVHDCTGQLEQGGTHFSNAATSINEFKI